ncbi:hypothetical protein LX64_05057 [Chitinophaga skermanii]|uniref:Uncharacterized protein n=1 Tax=Chitinophaga skermanii TaxID=331697 RepID=A0A327PZR7_9BACT|nr:hypothetical protein [Chitinophaga skermanii]RAI97549.1 hypothetical protein LX64_05057 [Chitinophaga skermanii]
MYRQEKNVQFIANIGQHQTYPQYFESYNAAVSILIAHIEQHANTCHTLAYPIMFLVRHGIELGLKNNIQFFQHYTKQSTPNTIYTHQLKFLQTQFKSQLFEAIALLQATKHINIDPHDLHQFHLYFQQLDTLTNLFELLDKNADAFRYPVNTKNNASFQYEQTVNLMEVVHLLQAVEWLLCFTGDVFKKYWDEAMPTTH